MNKPTQTQYTLILAIIVMVVVALWKNEKGDVKPIYLDSAMFVGTGTISTVLRSDDCSCSCDFNPIINHSEIRKGE